ncbi:hypothetical protein [Methylobacterium sp. J-068]|uniref:hypothetical protein n=1 Tax=Methylobacterium sp. J-068 TaxID=2836649 RepID=UPI001FBA3D89|nr:hypothetical protein [Methylobacterium sp. J-068]MCJ2035317.1 hypothetical protein [Methylobacterium sp. J-068]
MTGWLRTLGPALAIVLIGANLAPLRAETAVVACETLVQLRVLMASGDRVAAEAALPGHPGCRTIPRGRIGAAEHRAMVGGAPFECLAVSGESACAWVWP